MNLDIKQTAMCLSIHDSVLITYPQSGLSTTVQEMGWDMGKEATEKRKEKKKKQLVNRYSYRSTTSFVVDILFPVAPFSVLVLLPLCFLFFLPLELGLRLSVLVHHLPFFFWSSFVTLLLFISCCLSHPIPSIRPSIPSPTPCPCSVRLFCCVLL